MLLPLQLRFEPELGVVWTLGLAILLVVSVALGARGLSLESSPRRRRILLGARVLGVLWVLGGLLQPTFLTRASSAVEAGLVVMVDGSRSMSFPEEGGDESRASAVRAWVSSQDDLPEGFPLRWVRFGEGLSAASREELAERLEARDSRSELARGISSLTRRGAEDEVGGIVVLSDGGDPELSEAVASLAQRGVAIHTVDMPLPASFRDDAIVSVDADPVGFLRQPVRVEVTVRSLGGGRDRIPVVLKQGGRVLREAVAYLDEEGEATVSLDVTPDRLGRALYRVAIAAEEGDAVALNNEAAFLVRVQRDRLRVLLVAGRPSWDVRFMREFLKRRESIDLISFFILRTSADLAMADQSELALIPFPTDELFREHLASFDVVLFQNFNFEPYQMAGYLPRVRDYVMRGGSFAMIGGELSFAGGDYAPTPIANILPVVVPPTQADAVFPETYTPEVRDEARHHPIVAILPDPALNADAWRRLSPMVGGNRVLAVRPETQVLLHYPGRRLATGEAHPVLSVFEVGRGRSLALTGDSSWKWGMASGDERGDAAWYEHFWDRALRWLSRDPSLDPCQVQVERETYGSADRVSFDATVRAADYAPLPDTEMRVVVTGLDGDDVSEASLTTDAEGQLRGEVAAPETDGGYFLRLMRAGSADSTDDETDTQLQCEEAFVVSEGGAELRDPRPKTTVLRALSEQSGGEHFSALTDMPPLENLSRTRRTQEREQSYRIFTSPIMIALGCLFLVGEWVLRRRWGLR